MLSQNFVVNGHEISCFSVKESQGISFSQMNGNSV